MYVHSVEHRFQPPRKAATSLRIQRFINTHLPATAIILNNMRAFINLYNKV